MRNRFYDRDVFSRIRFDVPIVSIGNLSTGGTGKTPMVEHIIEAFYQDYKMAVLSRGYRRRSKGFRLAGPESTSTSIGDEPYQYYLKYPRVSVSVCEDRVIGVPLLLSERPETDVILLDDAYQHRSITPGINILLTRYDRPFTRDHILPMGSLRESRAGKSRADIIVLTKCPSNLSEDEARKWETEIEPEAHQSVFFATLEYPMPYLLLDPTQSHELTHQNVVVVSGLASNKSLLAYLNSQCASVHALSYSDHQNYNLQKVEEIKEAYRNMPDPKMIVTTEKDAVKLIDNKEAFENIPLYVLPIKTKILFDQEDEYHQIIKNYINKNLDAQEEKPTNA